MNTDLKRVRDGHANDEPGNGSPLKKRSLGSSRPEGKEEDRLGDWMDVVESKRKEAIYRQMLEYRRAFEAEQKRAHELEEQHRILEASIQAVEVCWTQVVNAVQTLAGQSLEIEGDALKPRLEARCQYGQLEQAIQARLPVTQRILQSFGEIASKGGLRPNSSEDLQNRCKQLEIENNTLKSSEHILQGQVSTLAESNTELQRELDKARKGLDRQRMEHDKARLDWQDLDGIRKRESATPGARANGSGHATPNGKMDEDVKPALSGAAADVQLQDTSELEKLAATRLKELEDLRQQYTAVQQEHDRLKVLASSPTEEALRASPFFQVYLQRLAFQQNRADELQQHVTINETKLDGLRQTNLDFRDAVVTEARQEIDALRQQSGKKDQDSARLRGQRDEIQAELTERTAREAEKMQSIEHFEALANTRQERITFLISEVRRLKGSLAAQAGSEGYLAFLKGDGGIDGDYIRDLESKLTSTSAQIASLEARIEVADANPDAQIRTELDEARIALAKYQRILGPNPEVAEDIRQMAEKLEQADKDNKALQLQLEEAEAATNALYTEVEGLSKLYEDLDTKVKSKCFELKDGELKLQRLITEKAKADNKFFAAMRAKEGIDAQAKMAQRTVEKQSKLLERAQEVEKSLQAQITAQEQAVTQLKNAMTELQRQMTTASSEKATLEHQLQHAQKHLSEAQQIMHIRVAESSSDREARRKLEEEAEVTAKTVKKLREKHEALIAAPGKDMSAGEWQLKEERDKLLKLLKCSCCEQNFKQQVIIKCMHTFCKGCLDSRIASRQRKCPACGAGFAKEDVQTLFWQ